MEDIYEKIFHTTNQFIKRVSREINYPIDRILETHLYDTNSVPASSPFEKLRLVLLLYDEGLLNLIWENITIYKQISGCFNKRAFRVCGPGKMLRSYIALEC